MKVIPGSIPGLLIVEPDVVRDDRGFFLETYSERRYREAGIPSFVQDNVSLSKRGVLRGLHVQHPHSQGKLVQVLMGEVFDVAVDVRVGSPWFGRWEGVAISAENKRQLYVPPGFAHGFFVVSDQALFSYKCTDYYHASTERSIAWNDPALAIEWPTTNVELSAKDRAASTLASIPLEHLPRYEG